ncbi:hypothetical protein [Mesorhizobium sp. STM 4661]|uniref:hypothetical protein n=1 Tax=Mesorhizobium sp. STM 4661 TaxID=1297570 RepID=UPI0003A5405D|nr:hypothetical protein [Mesorhizobium sp. STM 4661]
MGLFLAGVGYGWVKFEKAAQVAALKQQVIGLQTNIAILEADSSQAVADAEVIVIFDKKTKEDRDALVHKDTVCFDGPDADRVRRLWQN